MNKLNIEKNTGVLGMLCRDLTPVWLRVPGAIQISGIGRSRLYELIRDQKIRSKVLKQRRDSQRGIRLISYDSLLEFINGAGEWALPKMKQSPVEVGFQRSGTNLHFRDSHAICSRHHHGEAKGWTTGSSGFRVCCILSATPWKSSNYFEQQPQESRSSPVRLNEQSNEVRQQHRSEAKRRKTRLTLLHGQRLMPNSERR
jgi:hypothetical protein